MKLKRFTQQIQIFFLLFFNSIERKIYHRTKGFWLNRRGSICPFIIDFIFLIRRVSEKII